MAETSDTPVLDLLARMTADSLEATAPLDTRTVMLARLAALIAVDAPPMSYAVNVGAAAEADIDVDDIRGLLAAIAPIVGTPRVVAGVGNILSGLAIEVAALDALENGEL
jgi:alkylhydroperoxidase/carboxymuconolactone decarboxylase family protein YurZ